MPLYGLQAPGIDGSDGFPISTIEGLAAHYIEEIREFQPHGPYYMGGFCFAGVVAYEMARQLSEQGEELGMVALIDSYPRGTRPRPDRREIRRERLAEFRTGNARQRVLWFRDRLLRLKTRIRNRALLPQRLPRAGRPRQGRAAAAEAALEPRARRQQPGGTALHAAPLGRPGRVLPGRRPAPVTTDATGRVSPAEVVLHQVIGPRQPPDHHKGRGRTDPRRVPDAGWTRR